MKSVKPEELGALVAADLHQLQHGAVSEAARHLTIGLVQHYGDAPGVPFATGYHASGFAIGSPTAPTDVLEEGAGSYPRAGDNEVKKALSGWQPGDPIQISSHTGVPAVLDDPDSKHHSPQAPEGFVQQAIDEAGKRMADWKFEAPE